MAFVTEGHPVTGPDGLQTTEERDIVHVAMPDGFTRPVATPLPNPASLPRFATPLPDALAWRHDIATGPVRLFRFSASTFYEHRIHVDLPQATGIEKHPSLVVHGPLQAILLMAAGRAARRAGADRAGADRAGADGAGADGAGADGAGADGAGADGAGADEVMPAIFRFRRLRPAFDTDPLTLAAGPLAGLTQPLMTATPQGAFCTSAEMTWVS